MFHLYYLIQIGKYRGGQHHSQYGSHHNQSSGGGGYGVHSTLDEPDLKHRYGGSDSEESDIDRRSLDLASSHTSDDDYENNHVFDPSDLKALSVNDFPQH